MSSDNSSFEPGVGILWLMCTWAFQVLYSRAWQTSVATWPGVRDIWMKIALRFTLICSTCAWSVPSNAWSHLKMINWDNLFRILYTLYSDLPWSDPPNAWSNLKMNDYEITIYWSGVEPSTALDKPWIVSWECEYPWARVVESVPVLVCLREFVLMQLVCNSLQIKQQENPVAHLYVLHLGRGGRESLWRAIWPGPLPLLRVVIPVI